MWTAQVIAQTLADSLERAERDFQIEQSPMGLDALSETELHPILASGFAKTEQVVLREVPYPGSYTLRPHHRERERCDLVILPAGVDQLVDPLDLVRDEQDRASTLFADTAAPVPAGAHPDQAFWLEVKSIAQYAYVDDVPGPNRSYASLLTRGPTQDLVKLAREPMVATGGAGVVLFGSDAAGIRHDLGVMFSAMLDRDLPVSSPAIELVDIVDRAGNTVVGVCVVPLRVVRD